MKDAFAILRADKQLQSSIHDFALCFQAREFFRLADQGFVNVDVSASHKPMIHQFYRDWCIHAEELITGPHEPVIIPRKTCRKHMSRVWPIWPRSFSSERWEICRRAYIASERFLSPGDGNKLEIGARPSRAKAHDFWRPTVVVALLRWKGWVFAIKAAEQVRTVDRTLPSVHRWALWDSHLRGR